MRRFGSRLALLSAVHAAVDLACAALFFGFLRHGETGWVCMVLYNAFAFMFQLPLGILADRMNRNMLFAAVGCVLVASAFLLIKSPVLAAVAAGVGNGAFHVGGGVEVLSRSPEKAGPLGVFVSPGAIGLFLGKVFAGALALWPAVLMLVCAAALLLLGRGERGYVSGNAPVSFGVPRGGVFALVLLFLVVVLRSYLGFTPAFGTGELLSGLPPLLSGLIPVLCLAFGKAAGGFAADAFGARLTAVVSLGVCALLLFLPITPVFALIALFLFNMTMPITLHAAARLLSGLKGGAFGLLTFALFLGCIPALLGVETPALSWLFGALALASLVLLLLGLRKERA